MQKLAALGITAALAAAVPGGARADEARVPAGDTPPNPTELLIDLADDTGDEDERAIEALLGGLDLRLNSIHAADERFFVVEVGGADMARLIDAIDDDPRVEHVEPNHLYGIPEPEWLGGEVLDRTPDGSAADGAPNDPLWPRQWSFRMIGAPAAWARSTGAGVVVAVIDTGVAFEDHKSFRRVEDLEGVELVKPYDFVSDTEHPNDDHGHGTHVAGTIAQATNNGRGVAGIAHDATIMPLKVLNRNGMGTVADIADAIRYAADEGAQVINMSLGGGARSQVMESAVAYARKKGVVVVCAAGNGSRGQVEYPAAYPGAFAVSSVGPDKKLAFYSSWGKELAVSAPGGDKQKGGEAGAILQNTISPSSVSKTDLYLAFQGTSMAAPHVAGVAALVIGRGVTDPAKVEAILKSTAEDVGEAGWDDRYGAGIVNAERAVAAAAGQSGGLGYLMAGLGVLAMFLVRAGKLLGRAKLGAGWAILGTVLAASGLWLLERLGLPVAGLSGGLPTWDGAVLGAGARMTAIWASALPLFLATVLLLGVKRLRGLLVGLALGWAAHLLVASVLMPSDVVLIPGTAGALDRVWLILNGGVLVLLAAVVARVHARST